MSTGSVGALMFLYILWYMFLVFLGICACIVLIKLAFGTLHIHITVDNFYELSKKAKGEGETGKYNVDMQKVETAFAETPQEKELRRFKKMLRTRGTLSPEEIDRITYEDLENMKGMQ